METATNKTKNYIWGDVKAGDYIRYVVPVKLFNKWFTKGQLYPVFDVSEVQNHYTGPYRMVNIGCKDHKVRTFHVMIEDDPGSASQGTITYLFIKDDMSEYKDCTETSDANATPWVNLIDTLTYFISEYREDTPVEDIMRHLPSDPELVHTLEDFIFRIVCAFGNIETIKWFMTEYDCKISYRCKYTPRLTSWNSYEEFGLINDYTYVSTHISHELVAALDKYDSGRLFDSLNIIMGSYDIHKIYELVIPSGITAGAIRQKVYPFTVQTIMQYCMDDEIGGKYDEDERVSVLMLLKPTDLTIRTLLPFVESPNKPVILRYLWDRLMSESYLEI